MTFIIIFFSVVCFRSIQYVCMQYTFTTVLSAELFELEHIKVNVQCQF